MSKDQVLAKWPVGTRLRIEDPNLSGWGPVRIEGNVSDEGFVAGWDPWQREQFGAKITVLALPRPPEPKGLYAVVRGRLRWSSGRKMVFVRADNTSAPWRGQCDADDDPTWAGWDDIVELEILFEGVE